MLILTNTTDNIEVVLGGNVTTNQLQCVSSWRDVTTTTYTPGRTVTNTNNTTAVNAVPAPAASTQRVVDLINIYNNDTATATVTVRYDANGTEYILWSGVLAIGDTLSYVEGAGWSIQNDGYQPVKEYVLHADGGAALTMTNATQAERFVLGATRFIIPINARGYTQCRFLANVQVVSASVNTPLVRLRYYTSWNSTFSNYLQLGDSGHVQISVFTGTVNTLQDTGWVNMAAGAREDGIAIAMCELGGDGVADPAIGHARLWLR